MHLPYILMNRTVPAIYNIIRPFCMSADVYFVYFGPFVSLPLWQDHELHHGPAIHGIFIFNMTTKCNILMATEEDNFSKCSDIILCKLFSPTSTYSEPIRDGL